MALQAQIEPYFLFNSLTHTGVLTVCDPADAWRLPRHLIGLLYSSLSHARAEQCMLAQEFVLLCAYLDIQALRFGNRLCSSLALDDTVASIVIPPMLIQPLVGDTVVHGIEPAHEGGEIILSVCLAASSEGERLMLGVHDTGINFGNDDTKGSGLDLAHVCERLSRLFDGDACLTITGTVPCGVTIIVELPLVHETVCVPSQPDALEQYYHFSCSTANATGAFPSRTFTGV